jgi:hypothetical protein
MASPSGAVVGTVKPLVDSVGNEYVVNAFGQMVVTFAPTVYNSPTAAINFVLYHGGFIYIQEANGAWYQWQVPSFITESGGGWNPSSDPR